MSGLKLRLKSSFPGRLDLSDLSAALCGHTGASEIARLPLAGGSVADLFDIQATGRDDESVLEGTTPACDGIGAGWSLGTLIVDGEAGAYCARHMKGGRVDVRGSAGDWIAAGLSGGLLTITGSAGHFAGGLLAGEKFGMSGGTVHVGGNIGERAGDRMRRGTIIVKGSAGSAAGSRMAGGTIWAEGGFGPGPGPLMRRGTLIGPSVARMLPTFNDCGVHDMVFLRLISRYSTDVLGPLSPAALPQRVRRFAGDMATIGKGEILLTA